MGGFFFAGLLIAAIAIAVAVRFLYLAWSDHRLGRERRRSADRRRRDIVVPIERRRHSRRD